MLKESYSATNLFSKTHVIVFHSIPIRNFLGNEKQSTCNHTSFLSFMSLLLHLDVVMKDASVLVYQSKGGQKGPAG